CTAFLDPLIRLADIDLASFSLEIALNRSVAPAKVMRFEFLEKVYEGTPATQPGLQEFLNDRSLRKDATTDEIEFLQQLRFKNGLRPTALYYYRELQNLRDPLHFRRK